VRARDGVPARLVDWVQPRAGMHAQGSSVRLWAVLMGHGVSLMIGCTVGWLSHPGVGVKEEMGNISVVI
jgi:hypothetical protein